MITRAAVRRSLAFALLAASLLAHPARAALTRVTGQVVDSGTLQPIAGADVELQNSGGGPGYHRARTDAKGEFAFDNVATQRWYSVSVGADGYADWDIESWQFPATQREVRIVVPLDRAGRVVVGVKGADGRTPVAGARVTLRAERASGWQEGGRREAEPRFTGRDGAVAFEGVRAGSFTLEVEAAGLLRNETRGVVVKRGETTALPLTLARPASLSGSVRLADSTGVAGVSVIARGPGEATATTDAGGFWALGELGPGRWRIEVSHDGLEGGVARDGVVLREGESRELPALRVTPRPASLAFVLQREVFSPPDKQQVGVRAFRIGALDLTLWRLPEALLVDASGDFRARFVQGADTTGLVRVEAWRHDLPGGAPFAWREESMALPHELPAGVYVLEGRAGAIARRVLFFVSDVGLVVKRSPTRTLVWAGSLRTGVPMAGVTVLGVSGGPDAAVSGGRDWGAALAAARGRGAVTDADGLVELPATGSASRLRVVAASEGHGVAIAEPPLSGAATQGGDRAFLFTERPIYRPGQGVDWKLFARAAQPGGWQVPASGDVAFSLTGPDDATFDVPGATLAGGSADGTIALPPDAPLGDWTLTARWGRAAASAVLAIQQYRKPEFEVQVAPERDVVVNGDEVRFRVAASYFFGAPVVGASVRYTLFESRIRGEDLWESTGGEGEGGEEPNAGYGRMLESGETRTDADGRVAIAFAPARVAYDRRLALEVEVVDGSQRSVSARGGVTVGRGLYVVELRPASPLVLAGQPLAVDVVTKDHAGRPVQAAVTVEVDQDVWNPLERRMTRASRPLASVSGATSALRGVTRLTVSPAVARAGSLVLRAFSDDPRGNRITAETSVWVYDPRVWSYPYRYPSLEAIAERDTFAPGDTAHVLVNTDVKDASVLVTVEGRELHERRVMHLFGNTGMVAVPVRPEYAPNVFVAIHVRRGAEVHSRVLELSVRGARHDLAIAVTSDRAEYRPRETAHLKVVTRDGAGVPVPAEVAVGVVDEAIYSLRADATADPHDVFYGRIPNAVSTVVSFPTLYYGGADKGDHGDVRRDFRDVALWAPRVVTGADGTADVPVTFPDNLTTWRATARGMSAATLVGTAVARVRVSKDVVARLAVPRALVAGDEAALVSVVTNRTDAPLTGVSESIAAKGAATLAGPAGATTSLAARGEARETWALTAATPARDADEPAVTLTFRAKSPADADAVEQVVPVRPRAVPLLLHGAGVLDAASGTTTVTLPADLVRAGSQVSIELSGSPAALALAAAEWLGGYPYGCTEQTTSAIVPAATLVTAARAAGVTLPGWQDPGARLGATIEHLLALRTGDGGWGWWRADDADPFFTCLAMEALARAAAADVRRDACVTALTGAGWQVDRWLADVREPDGEAYCAAKLSAVVALPEAAHPPLAGLRETVGTLAGIAFAQRDRLGVSGLACAALAEQRLGRAGEAKTLLDALLARASSRGDALVFPPAGEEGWWNEESETVGYALSALSAIAPADPRGPALVRALLARRAGAHWRSTRVTGVAATALADWMAAHPGEFAAGGGATARWNADTALALPAGAGGAPRRASTTLAGRALRPGANTLAIARTGTAPVWWSWEARAMVPSPGPDPRERRLAVKREYLHAQRVADRRGRPRWLTTPVDEKNPIRVGEVVLARLTLSAPSPLRFLMVEDPKPSGFEVDAVLPDGAERPWGTWAEARDERSVFFVRDLDAGESVIEYLLRPEIAGAFTALPTSAGSMYDPDLLVRGAEERLRVSVP